MNPNQQWLDIKESYLKQVEKNLARIDHPRRVEILSDVSQHLESKYAELSAEERNWEGCQRIITEMGPPQDYAELLTVEPVTAKRRFGINELLAIVFVATLIAIGAYLVYTAAHNSPKELGSYTFKLDKRVLGKWVTVDFVDTIDQFAPEKRNWQSELFLHSLEFRSDGKVEYTVGSNESSLLDWTKGQVEPKSERPSFYYMRNIDDQDYMFFEWISGDVTVRGQQPSYYVLKKVSDESANSANRSSTTFITFSKIDLAWQYSKGKDVKIAVLDWLFDMSPEASAKYVDAISLVPDQPIGSDQPWHGEWMANIIHRIAPEAMIIPIRCRPDSEGNAKADDGRYIYEKYLIEAIRYAADHGAVAVTNSMGPVKQCKELQDAIDYAEQKGTIFIDVHPEYTPLIDKFAGSRTDCDNRIIHTGVISVPGYRVRPEEGRDIYVWPYDIDPVYKDGWGFSNGPPIVAGVIALMKSANPELTPQEVRRIVTETAYANDNFKVLDAESAVKKALQLKDIADKKGENQ